MKDREDLPPFELDQEVNIPQRDIDSVASEVLEICIDAVNDLMHDYDCELSDYDRDTLRDEVMITLKNKINGGEMYI